MCEALRWEKGRGVFVHTGQRRQVTRTRAIWERGRAPCAGRHIRDQKDKRKPEEGSSGFREP